MSKIISSNQIGLALMNAGLYPFLLDTDMYQIVWDGGNYTVYTGSLPEVYIETTVMLDLFEYNKDLSILYSAIDKVNWRLSPVVAYRVSDDTVSFRICLRPESEDAFLKDMNTYFERIGQAIDVFGQACYLATRNQQ